MASSITKESKNNAALTKENKDKGETFGDFATTFGDHPSPSTFGAIRKALSKESKNSASLTKESKP